MSAFIFNVTFDCAQPRKLAGFWSKVTDYTPITERDDFVALQAPDKRGVQHILFFQVPEPKIAKNRVHLDLAAKDPGEEIERLVALGRVPRRERNELDGHARSGGERVLCRLSPPTETVTIGHRRTDVTSETAALPGDSLHYCFWRIKIRARSGWHEAEPNLPLGIVHVEVHQHYGLPCAECRTTPKHGKSDRGADERGENVVSPMTRRAVSMLISIITREQSVQSIF
jgi:hypothetical protein